MAKSNRRMGLTYPEEREGRVRDANKKLRSQIKNLQKRIRQLESENKTLSRAFDKSCDFIQDKLKDKSFEEIINLINNFDYKETEKGRAKENSCPKCEASSKEGYQTMDFGKIIITKCKKCGFRSKANADEGIKGS